MKECIKHVGGLADLQTAAKFYRELVKPKDAEKWFVVKLEQPANIVTLAAEARTSAPDTPAIALDAHQRA